MVSTNKTENTVPLKVLLCAVPFGCDNLGDEGILMGVVQLLRDLDLPLEITASTEDVPPTSKRLGIATVPLLGFGKEPVRGPKARSILAAHDIVIWSGATGLSDYPDEALDLLELAQEAGKTTLLFGVGMNASLNPYLYTLLPGRRRQLFDLVQKLTFGRVRLRERMESLGLKRVRDRMNHILPRTELRVLRGPMAARNLSKWCEDLSVLVGADPALLVRPTDWAAIPLNDGCRSALETDQVRIGISISAQSPVEDLAGLAHCLGRIQAEHRAMLVGIPVNIQTDAPLMNRFRSMLPDPEQMVIADQIDQPGHVVALSARCRAMVSSRLHGLILAAAADTPLVGIARGTKINNFLFEYDQPAAGTVEEPDYKLIETQLRAQLVTGSEIPGRMRATRARLLDRIQTASHALREVLERAWKRKNPSGSHSVNP